MGLVIAVAGAVGGIGASTFAWAIAQQVSSTLGANIRSCLIDAQADGAPLDLIVGCERTPGIRWSQVRVRSTEIAADVILDAVPQHLGVSVLSSDREATVDPVALSNIVSVLRREQCAVVIDLAARDPLRSTLSTDVDVLLIPPTMPGIVAAHGTTLSSTQLVVADVGWADVTIDQLGTHLGRAPVGSLRWQRAVRAAAVSGIALPSSSDVMRVAASILGAAHAR